VALCADKDKEISLDLGKGVKLDMVLIPAGSFTMGNDKASSAHPNHTVQITKPFYMGKYEVTQEQWNAVMGNNPSHHKGAKNPVESVSWDDCQEFIKKLNSKLTGKTVRLPTEAEWEYACKAGTQTFYFFGDDQKDLDQYAELPDLTSHKM